MRRLALIDGEHYPPVTKWAIEKLGDVCCAVFLGGGEKIGSPEKLAEELGVRLYVDEDPLKALELALSENDVDEVVDLSDEPVVDYSARFRIASICLRNGVTYRGADFEFRPGELIKPSKPTISVLGLGKRVGKTAVGSFVARVLKERYRPVVVTMGRGGPERPELIEGEREELTPENLLKLAEMGKHAASDHYEDALVAGVTTIGCRRCGGGMAGFPFFHVVHEGIKLAEGLPHDIIIAEGSGATIPPVLADGYITVLSTLQPRETVEGFFGPFRIGLADIAVITMTDVEPRKAEEFRDFVRRINPNADVHLVRFTPKPLGEVSGKRVALFMTSERAIKRAVGDIEGLGAEVVFASGNLSKRPSLEGDLGKLGRKTGVDAVLVELKAAAVDVVTRWALERGIEVVYLANEPVNVDGKDLRKAVLELARRVVGR
ncbi:2,3-diphosphoglycerate synthetase [Thermococcus sp. 21S9]|uniref:2,3-diphosphoglycerate synthetase n=1 Tax=Thermococcus sp. 21S9 TaxID=1638223 RepID=UPI001439114E|nr:2,3-diphosphoglycerate synthetase [Thermococcus sp. 21S9]NJE53776.1 2,3-diphosphoglycerate synthetase [Thermococcus sp. 21S9]